MFGCGAKGWLAGALLGAVALCTDWTAAAPPRAEKVPTFSVRARVTSAGGKEPAAEQKFGFRLGASASEVAGNGWSEPLKFDSAQVDAALKAFSPYAEGWPVKAALAVSGVVDPTKVELEISIDGVQQAVKSSAELFGPSLGLALWRDEKDQPRVGTLADFNQVRYWDAIREVKVPEELRPKKLLIIDRFIGGDEDRRNWREGITNLSHAGFSAILLPPSKPVRALLQETPIKKIAWAIYCPPGYAFDTGKPAQTEQWAQKEADTYLQAGYLPTDMAAFAMSDEPGWYYPSQLKMLDEPGALKRFHEYLMAQKLEPRDVGAGNWEAVKPIARSGAKDLASKRLYYWTMRFFAWDSNRYFAECTKALEKAFYPGMPITVNFNFFAGRFYVPGAVANNPDKTSPDAGMGGNDWLEFGRMRGSTMLWTEDWFGDSLAYQWSFYCAKMRSAAEKGQVNFGGYVIGRTAGGRDEGVLQKMLSIVGNGGKVIKFYVFGPEYEFPGNCYSENPTLLKKIAEANMCIGKAEELLWEGKRPRSQVAILSPRSSEPWDSVGISDATNNNLNAATVDYMAEVADLYLALQHANTAVDFVEEEDLSAQGLASYKVLYLTEPDVPEEAQHGVAEWVKAGGTLVTVSGAAAQDRYNEPCKVLSDATGVREEPRQRMNIADISDLKDVARGKGQAGEFGALGIRGKIIGQPGEVIASFDNGTPAVVRKKVERGNVVHFAWMPGLSYRRSATGTKDQLPTGFSESLRRYITMPLKLAGVQAPVSASVAMVETPMLVSEKGAALTILNWTGEPIEKLTLTVRPGFEVKSATSVRGQEVGMKKTTDGIELTLAVKGADILLLHK